jgi:cytochrome c oxidase assembly protein subunit 15
MNTLTPDSPNPVPRWLRAWSVATALAAGAVVVLGSLITTFKVGMADPVWPTEPWFLVVNSHVWANEPRSGFLIEHTHRLFAWGIGVFATVLAFGAWAGESNRRLKWLGLAALGVLLIAYLSLHGEMGAAWRARKAGGDLHWPAGTAPACILAAFAVLAACGYALRRGTPGVGFRVAAALGLLAVMIQGLLGGYRVYLDQLMGTQLAAIHGSFGQVTLALLVATAVLARPRAAVATGWLRDWTAALVAAVVLQLVWGVWVRHLASPVAQRLHILTAFAVVAIVAAVVLRVNQSAGLRRGFAGLTAVLGVIVVGQLLLGVEAYIGKFVVTGPEALKPPELRSIKPGAAAVRTLHTLLGAGLLAAATALAVRAWVASGRAGGGTAEQLEPVAAGGGA